MIRYPLVTVRPVSGVCLSVQDVHCTACGTVHTACTGDESGVLASQHRQDHAAYTVSAVLITAAVAAICWMAAGIWPQLEMTPLAAALVGGLAAAVAARWMSPARTARRRVTSVGRGRRDA
jgi:apolipoprotein N-acyltransferase